MPLLPAKNSTQEFDQSAQAVLADLKKGGSEKRNEFVWIQQERVFAVALLGTGSQESAAQVTISAFNNAFAALNHSLPKNPEMSVWDWLSQYVVEAMGEFHNEFSGAPDDEDADPAQDGSANMDWETTVLLGVQRVKRCINQLPQDQKRVFLLRHSLDLNYDQISIVTNQKVEKCIALLYRARVQVVKCLGRG
ncbi:MAG TPA: sigma-70 family RNA polymerase sigma factor [Candidatus Obscuribacter sp.]|nr:sigma-70 family RNA polymerase sigma factor [Candidatus Obscuribacter sp.]MBK9282401.1 sigma-70 family RNA polymerase sigma factor [Candidatus Obscuribacter sp.]MBL8083010.1 sigma-70 family RNA polymerase sigma factor [Candidatus Obscuribacter sp.]HMW90307.1 sigma-70 family RNA polymerase sigma factor [Candidatus Obscuribacter sp.]HMX44317.1 sigma-70 family RNA polymerase sigma factor [Candidatus Obscuribacter sp.]